MIRCRVGNGRGFRDAGEHQDPLRRSQQLAGCATKVCYDVAVGKCRAEKDAEVRLFAMVCGVNVDRCEGGCSDFTRGTSSATSSPGYRLIMFAVGRTKRQPRGWKAD